MPATPDQFVVLGIETSCDETAAAVVADGTTVLSSVVSSQVDLHARYGGVVPEIASRAHVELLTPAVSQALVESGIEGSHQLSAVAATVGPGLAGALLVGISAAKAYSLAWGLPFIGVNHMEAHLYACFLEEPDLQPPLVVLLVSGGHTMLVAMDDHGKYRLMGTTVDDAVGEAFDKVARVMGLGYPGGPAIDRAALTGDPTAVKFPRAMPEGYDFSLSGLKTAVIRYVRENPDTPITDVAASFQAAVVDVLVAKTKRAAAEVGATGICLGGGVAANSLLRERMLDLCTADGLRCFLPSRSMCTDNAAMVAAAAWWRYRSDGPTSLEVGANPNLRLA